MIFIENLGKSFISLISGIGKLILFITLFFRYFFKPKFYLKINFKYFIDVFISSIPIIALTGIFSGMVLALQSYTGFSRFSAESAIPNIVVLTLTLVGTLKKLFLTGKYQFISLLLYLAMGWLIIFDINSLFKLIDFNAKLLLILGGVSYTCGVIFYVLGKIKYFHSIWHLLVLTGSGFHYFMILFYVI